MELFHTDTVDPNFVGVPIGPDRSCWGQSKHKP